MNEQKPVSLDLKVRGMGLSARAHDRVLKVARTLADLEGHDAVGANHVAEALQYRFTDAGDGLV